jgi:hypothetical protein
VRIAATARKSAGASADCFKLRVCTGLRPAAASASSATVRIEAVIGSVVMTFVIA